MTDARLSSDFDLTRFWELPDVPVLPGDEDLESYLRRLGFSDAQMQYIRRSYANATGEAPQYISAQASLDGPEPAGVQARSRIEWAGQRLHVLHFLQGGLRTALQEIQAQFIRRRLNLDARRNHDALDLRLRSARAHCARRARRFGGGAGSAATADSSVAAASCRRSTTARASGAKSSDASAATSRAIAAAGACTVVA